MAKSQHDQALSSFLDLSRWIAAWVVMFGHVRGHVFPDYKLIVDPPLAVRGFLFAVFTGQAAVMVFFVLSGFLVGGALVRAPAGAASVIKYFIARICRLYVVLIPAFALSAVFGLLRYWISGGADAALFGPAYSVRTLLVNLGFLQLVLGPQYADNYPLWSLTNEFWYYVAFPILLFAFRERRRRPLIALVAAAVAVVLLAALSRAIALYFSIWLIGVAAAVAKPLEQRAWPFLVMLAAAVTVSRLWFGGGYFPADLAVGLTFAFVLSCAQRASFAPAWLVRLKGMNAQLAGCSFTLYVLHAPLLALMLSFHGTAPFKLDVHRAASWGVYFSLCMTIVAIAYLVARLTEAHTYAIRTRVTRRVLGAA